MQSLPSIGLEEEVFTGSRLGHVVGMSAEVHSSIPSYTTEPDCRTVEYRTRPSPRVDVALRELAVRRVTLRNFLAKKNLTVIPGGTLSLGDSHSFKISDATNPYYLWIRQEYGARVVTAGLHASVGISDLDTLFRIYRVLRCEAPIFLALSACSPFLDGELTGALSTRWQLFPKNPLRVPFFRDFETYHTWLATQLKKGTMQNTRHLWLATRPNGPDKMRQLDRIELRICDQIWDLNLMGGVMTLLQQRAGLIASDSRIDPLLKADENELITVCSINEQSVSVN
jgi:predicted glutamate--cysteine ligase